MNPPDFPVGNIAIQWQDRMNSKKECFRYLFNNETMSDIQFVVNTNERDKRKRLYAHKFILAISSSVFETLFYGPLTNNIKEMEIVDITPEAFEIILYFIYTEELVYSTDLQFMCMIMYAAKKYQINKLIQVCYDYMMNKITHNTAWEILVHARRYNVKDLSNTCLEVIEDHTEAAISTEESLAIDLESLCTVLKSDLLMIREELLFNYVLRWSKSECIRQNLSDSIKNLRKVLGDAIKLIRFPLMTYEQIATLSGESKFSILTKKEILTIYKQKSFGNHCESPIFSRNQRRVYRYFNVVDNDEEFSEEFCDTEIDFEPNEDSDLLGFAINTENLGFDFKQRLIKRISLEFLTEDGDWEEEEDNYKFFLRKSRNQVLIRFHEKVNIDAYERCRLFIEMRKELCMPCRFMKQHSVYMNLDGKKTVLTFRNSNCTTFVYGLLFSIKE